MPRALITCALLFLCVCAACGESEGDSANSSGNVSTAMICEETGNSVADAIRALPQECVSDDECQVVERAGNCECAKAATRDADLSEFETALAALDANECLHPFTCADDQCSYDRGYREPELIGTCEMGECVVTEAMTCAEFEENVYGGLVAPSRCETADDCVLRNDLNPCGCQEAVGEAFPFLAAQSTYDLIAVNRDRCEFVCEVCPPVTEAACIQNVCIAQ